jgi:hypothetical protein
MKRVSGTKGRDELFFFSSRTEDKRKERTGMWQNVAQYNLNWHVIYELAHACKQHACL